jgi:DNA-binding transcriptional LysR family regulator
MNTRDLFAFKTVCECKSISKAAKQLYTSPQGLGKRMKNLERELDVKLLIRSPYGIELTSDGAVLEKKATSLIYELESLQHNFEKYKKRKQEKLHLVSSYGIIRYYSPQFFMKFKEKYPDINFSYDEYPDIITDHMVEHGDEATIGLAVEPVDEEKFEKWVLHGFNLKLLVNKKHTLASKKKISYHDLDSLDMIIESEKFKIHNIFMNKCSENAVSPNICFKTSGFSLCHRLCKTHNYASLTMDFISEDMKDTNLTTIPFDDPHLIWSICLIKRKQDLLSDAGRLFRDFLLDWNERR